MNPAFDTIKLTWPRILTGGTLVIILLAFIVIVSWFVSIQSADASVSRPRGDGKGDRTILRVCYGGKSKKNQLDKQDLEAIATKFNLKKNERPDFEDILRLNHSCKTSPTAEALVCIEGPCFPSHAGMQCNGCVIMVPMRE